MFLLHIGDMICIQVLPFYDTYINFYMELSNDRVKSTSFCLIKSSLGNEKVCNYDTIKQEFIVSCCKSISLCTTRMFWQSEDSEILKLDRWTLGNGCGNLAERSILTQESSLQQFL